MFRSSKVRYCPMFWGNDVGIEPDHEERIRAESSVLLDRYDRGSVTWGRLLTTRWWRFKEQRVLTRRLDALRAEYVDLLKTLVDAEQKRRVHVVDVPYPSKAAFVTSTPKGKTITYTPGVDDPTGTTTFIPMTMGEVTFNDDGDRRFAQAFDLTPAAPSPAAPAASSDHHFGGAGATGSWDNDSTDSSSSSDSGSFSDD